MSLPAINNNGIRTPIKPADTKKPPVQTSLPAIIHASQAPVQTYANPVLARVKAQSNGTRLSYDDIMAKARAKNKEL